MDLRAIGGDRELDDLRDLKDMLQQRERILVDERLRRGATLLMRR